MQRIIKLEWTKVSSYNFFRAILILTGVLFLLVLFVMSRIDVSVPGFSWRNVFRFPNIWQTFTWVASWFNVLLAIMVIVITGNEFASRSFRQQVMTGLSRNEWLIGKLTLVLGLALFGLALVIIAGAIFGLIFTSNLALADIFLKSGILFVYFLQAIGYMVLALLLITLLRSNALAIVMYMLYFIFIEPVVRLLCPVELRPWFPVKIISRLTPMPEFLQLASSGSGNMSGESLTFENIGIMSKQLPQATNLIMAIVYILIFGFLTWLLIKKRDL